MNDSTRQRIDLPGCRFPIHRANVAQTVRTPERFGVVAGGEPRIDLAAIVAEKIALVADGLKRMLAGLASASRRSP